MYSKMALGSSIYFVLFLMMLGEFRSAVPKLSVDLVLDIERIIPGLCSLLGEFGSWDWFPRLFFSINCFYKTFTRSGWIRSGYGNLKFLPPEFGYKRFWGYPELISLGDINPPESGLIKGLIKSVLDPFSLMRLIIYSLRPSWWEMEFWKCVYGESVISIWLLFLDWFTDLPLLSTTFLPPR